ncbi:hypothetical protein K432DRAFT_287186, partial [Lepidopterella palustris CBS 459.81]
HVPRVSVEVEEIPVTINGKRVEIGVESLTSGRSIKVSSTVANPKCLLEYERFRGIEMEPRETKL